MIRTLNSTAVILLLLWAIGVIGFGLNGLIHLLFILAVLVLIIRMLLDRKIY